MADKPYIVKKRYWAFVLYLESAPSNWRDLLTQTGLPCCISPYHDHDVNPDGAPKKPHYHIILCYSGPTALTAIKPLVVDTLHQPLPIPLESVKGYYRYLTHKDNPEKYQYSEADITGLNGFCIEDYASLTMLEAQELLVYITGILKCEGIKEYSEAVDFFITAHDYQSLAFITTHTFHFTAYLRSARIAAGDQEPRADPLDRAATGKLAGTPAPAPGD